jgi:sRNA-binding carbon storage regulator CsrA
LASRADRARGVIDASGERIMYVLMRKRGESVAVGGETPFERLLTVTVIEIAGDSVRLAIETKEDAPVYPLEGWDGFRLGGPQGDPTLRFAVVRGHC